MYTHVSKVGVKVTSKRSTSSRSNCILMVIISFELANNNGIIIALYGLVFAFSYYVVHKLEETKTRHPLHSC